MANICITRYTFKGSDVNEINMLFYAIRVGYKTSIKTMLDTLGVDNINTIYCAGAIAEFYRPDGNTIKMVMESKWTYVGIAWKEAIKALKLKTVDFCFESEEPGNNIFEKYNTKLDPDIDKYDVYIDISEDALNDGKDYCNYTGGGEFYVSKLDFIDFAYRILGITYNDLSEHIKNTISEKDTDALSQYLATSVNIEYGDSIVIKFFKYIQDLFS